MAIYVKKEPNLISKQHIVTVSYSTPKTVLGQHAEQLVVSPDTRTIWYEGVPYGTAYQFAPQNNGNVSGDVFGDVTSHSLNAKNELAAGTGIVTYNNNTVGIGIYNKYNNTTTDSQSYAFAIGNGTSNTARSNAMTVTRAGDVVAYQIANTKLDTSYVSSLGRAANVNIVLKALLNEPTEYKDRKPQFTVSLGSTQNLLVGATSAQQTLSGSFSGNRPHYGEKYIYKYIENNDKLPSGVTNNDLGYTSALRGDSSQNYITQYEGYLKYSAIKYAYGIDNTGNSPVLNTATIPFYFNQLAAQSETVSLHPYANTYSYYCYFGSDSSHTAANTLTPNLKPTKPGIYQIVKINTNIYWDTQQTMCFQQLLDKGVAVLCEGEKGVWTGANLYTNINKETLMYVGFNFYYGIFGLTSQDSVPTADMMNKILNSTSQSGVENVIMKKELVTNNTGTAYLPTSNTDVIFGKTRMGISSFSDGDKKCVFFAFPTGCWEQKNYNTAAVGDFKIAQTPGDNLPTQKFGDEYSFTTNITTNGVTNQYTVLASAVVTDTIYFSGDTTAHSCVYLKLNQTGLNTRYNLQ